MPIHLTAGQVVYLETIHVEGAGGDHSAVTVTINTNAIPPTNGAPPIDGSQFAKKHNDSRKIFWRPRESLKSP